MEDIAVATQSSSSSTPISYIDLFFALLLLLVLAYQSGCMYHILLVHERVRGKPQARQVKVVGVVLHPHPSINPSIHLHHLF